MSTLEKSLPANSEAVGSTIAGIVFSKSGLEMIGLNRFIFLDYLHKASNAAKS
jgi:hypothetical protein